MKKVCFCLKMPQNSYIGGIAAIVKNYSTNNQIFMQYGYDTCVFDYCNDIISKIKFSPLKTALYGIGQWINLKKYIKEQSIDVVHIHTSCRSLFWKDVILMSKISRHFNIKVVMTIHVGDIDTVFKKIPNIIRPNLISRLNKHSSSVVFLSKKIRDQFLNSGLEEKKSKILYNFYDGLSNGASPKSKRRDLLRLLFMGMINHDKGIIELLQSIQTLDDIPLHLDVCGTVTDESIRDSYNELVEKNQNIVTLHGYITGEEKNKIFEAADILVLPSYREGFPLVVLEALATKCGIIATKVGALPEILTDENVKWVEIGDVNSLSQAIRDLYENNEHLNSMKENNAIMANQFTKEVHIKNLCEIYNS